MALVRRFAGTMGTALVLTLGVMAAAATVALAQAGGPAWTSLDGTPEGTPAEVLFDTAVSGPSTTTFDLLIHGFYSSPHLDPAGAVYQEITVPGLERLGIEGAPVLPVLRRPLAIVTSAAQVTLASMTPLLPAMGFSLHVWPQPVPARDDPFGTPEVFQMDPAIYGSTGPYPTNEGGASALYSALGSIQASQVECYPIRWIPASDLLLITPLSRWTFTHDGPQLAYDMITKDRSRIASKLFLNWQNASQAIGTNLLHYQGEYLFIYPSAFGPAIQKLVNQKKWRGFNVTQITTESLRTVTCASVRGVIQNWYASTPSNRDHDCLLVGDINLIPFCPLPPGTDDFTDDLYGSVHHDSLSRDVFIGRLPGYTAADIGNQVKKIINYEDHPPGPLYYGDVLLVAHKPDPMIAEQNFPAQQNAILNQPYAVNPLFGTYYGSDMGRDNPGLTNHINSGYGIVCYRGHGGANDWNLWDLDGKCLPWWPMYKGDCYTNDEVKLLTNGPLNSIVWSIACSNADLHDASCIGRQWMTTADNAAVAHYGSTLTSASADNNTLEDRLFKAVWNSGITNLAHATTLAEDQCLLANQGDAWYNAWRYALFGDPDMSVRRQMPPNWQVFASLTVISGPGQASLDIQLLDATGTPVPGALIGIWKPSGAGSPMTSPPAATVAFGAPSGSLAREATRPAFAQASSAADEVADNAYTGDDGRAHFVVNPQSSGFIFYSVRDSAGNSVMDSIAVSAPTDVAREAGTKHLELQAAPSITRGATTIRFGRPLAAPATVNVFDAAGRPVARLEVPRGAASVAWPGTNAAGAPARSGIYFVRLRAEGSEHSVRVVLRR